MYKALIQLFEQYRYQKIILMIFTYPRSKSNLNIQNVNTSLTWLAIICMDNWIKILAYRIFSFMASCMNRLKHCFLFSFIRCNVLFTRICRCTLIIVSLHKSLLVNITLVLIPWLCSIHAARDSYSFQQNSGNMYSMCFFKMTTYWY